MHRFYLPNKVTGDSAVISDGEQLHHLKDVLRLKPGDEVAVFDGEGSEFPARIDRLEKSQAVLQIQSRKPARPRPVKLAVACAIPKQAGMDDIIDKLTQLDTDVIIPLITERVVVKLDAGSPAAAARLERWKKIARSAAEQSQRNTLPVISPVLSFPEVLGLSRDYSLKLIPTLTGECRPLREVLSAQTQPAGALALIGPEGDFTPHEVEQALASGFIPVSLGETVLRVETAAVAIAGYIRLGLCP
jgi:16S rRNA (uracil1498-N3)-methyltransferase